MRLLLHDYAGHPFQVQLSRKLAARGHVVAHAYAGNLLTPRGTLHRREGDAPSLSFSEVPMSPDYRANKYSFLKRRGYELAYGRELGRLVRRIKPDVVISGNTPTEPQWRLIQTAGKLKIPVVSWVQDFYSLAVDKLARKKIPVLGSMAGAWYRHLDGRCFQASAGIVSITEDFVPVLAGFGVASQRIKVIPNWAPLEELPVLPRQNEWAKGHRLEDKFVFHYSGTLAMKHNPEILRQLALRFRDDPAVRVVVVSEGPGADYLKEKQQKENLDNLIVLPFQDFSVMPQVLAASEVLVAVLEADAGVFSVPSKILTYHCVRRPILAAMPLENLAARILVRNGGGLVVKPDDIEGFLSGARQLRGSQETRDKLAMAARNYAEQHFAIEGIADQFESVMKAACQAPN